MTERLGVHYVAEPRPRRYDPNEHLSRRHLPGKHNQKDHGHGHAAGGYKPGAWKKTSNDDDARTRQLQDNLEKDLPPSTKKKMIERDGPDAVRKLAEQMAGTNGVFYTNGEHTVRVTSARVTEEQQHKFLSTVDVLQTHFPVDGKLDITIANSREFDLGVGGETYTGTGSMRFNDVLFRRDANGVGWPGMPVAERVSASEYVLLHEWGHAVDNQTGTKNISEMTRSPKVRKAMSEYGKSMPHEGYAEAFAEWAYTQGKTENEAAQAYAERYGWGERWPSLSTTSKAA